MKNAIVGLLLAACMLGGSGELRAQPGSPAGPVAPELLRTRRAALVARLGGTPAILRAAAERSIEGDYPQDSDYRERNDFFYLTGIERADAALVITAAGEAVLYLPQRNVLMESWTGPKLGPGAEAAAISGVADTRPVHTLQDDLRGWLGASGPVFVSERDSAWADSVAGRKLERRDLEEQTAALRLVKDADELARLRRAIDITTASMKEAMAAARPGAWEYEIEAMIEYGFRRRGAERVGFPSIVGSGPNSTVLHYDKSRRQTQPGDLVVADIGAEFGYYTADVTRTFPISGKFSERQLALYRVVLGAQNAAIAAVRPGITLGELNRVAREHMRANSGKLCGESTCDRYFMHGVSHWLGMDVHDVGSGTTPLRPGMVLTIEPGIYIPVEAIGIRIEDDVLVTETGGVLLSGGAPREPEAIERLMAGVASGS